MDAAREGGNLKSGSLRHRVTLQKPARIGDQYAGADVTWTDVEDIWVNIEPMSDRERFFAQQISTLQVHKVRMRYRSDIRQSWRLLYGTRILDTIGIKNSEERNRELELTCEEEPN